MFQGCWLRGGKIIKLSNYLPVLWGDYVDIIWQRALSWRKKKCFIFKRGIFDEVYVFTSQLCCKCQTVRQMKRWANEKRQQCVLMGDTSFDLLELCFEFQSILGSCSHFCQGPSLSLNSSLWFDVFYSWPGGGEFSFHAVLAGWASQSDAAGAGSCEVSCSRLFWQVLMCWGSNHWHSRAKLQTTGPCGPYMLSK